MSRGGVRAVVSGVVTARNGTGEGGLVTLCHKRGALYGSEYSRCGRAVVDEEHAGARAAAATRPPTRDSAPRAARRSRAAVAPRGAKARLRPLRRPRGLHRLGGPGGPGGRPRRAGPLPRRCARADRGVRRRPREVHRRRGHGRVRRSGRARRRRRASGPAGLRVLEAVAELRASGVALGARAAVNTGEAVVTWVAATPARRLRSATSSTRRRGCSRPHPSAASSSGRRLAARPGTRSRTSRCRRSRRRGRRRRSRPGCASAAGGAGRAARHARPVRRPRARARCRPLGLAASDGRPAAARRDGGRPAGDRQVAALPRARARSSRGGVASARPVRAVRGADRLPRLGAARPSGVRHLRLRPGAGRAREARRGRRALLPAPRPRTPPATSRSSSVSAPTRPS